jgi:beta-lactamase class A
MMRSLLAFCFLVSVSALAGCERRAEVPVEVPAPSPSPSATPITRVTPRIDRQLEEEFAEIASEAKGRVGVGAMVIETGDAAFLDANGRYPMQSVYKLPIAMAVLERISKGEVELEERIAVTPDDFVRPGFRSLIRDQNPNGAEFSIRELLELSLMESDGTASDVLLRLAGGPPAVQAFLARLGISDVRVENSEKEISRDWETQYRNWATPTSSVDLLTAIRGWEPEANETTVLLHDLLARSAPGDRRLKGLLPKDTTVAHKTGTGGTRDGITGATNDIGIVHLPNGRRLAIAIYISDSSADMRTREAVIARIAKAAYDRWAG